MEIKQEVLITKILNFGSCNIDYVYSMEHIVRVGETLSSYKLETFPGGKGLNQSIAIARAGATVYHAGCVGYDGAMLTDLLAESSVDISYIQTVDSKNGHAIIQVNAKGDNAIFIYPGSNAMLTEAFVDSVLENFEAGDLILLQNEINLVDYIMEKAYCKQMQIVFNPSPFQNEIRQLDLNKLSYMILNEVEAKELSGCESPEESLLFFRENYPDLKVILTLGEQGCIYVDREQEVHQSAYLIHVVDSTAAGDTFTGYFVAGISCGMTVQQSLRSASAASALSVSRNGAAPSIPMKAEVLEALRELKLRDANTKQDRLRRQIEIYIGEHIKDATLKGLAAYLKYSPVYTGALIKQLTGDTFSNYLQNMRCKMAAKLLLESDLSIKEIIHAVGYENESFFRNRFKEKYGKNPLQFRKRKADQT